MVVVVVSDGGGGSSSSSSTEIFPRILDCYVIEFLLKRITLSPVGSVHSSARNMPKT